MLGDRQRLPPQRQFVKPNSPCKVGWGGTVLWEIMSLRPLLPTDVCLQAEHGTQGRQEVAGVRFETWRRARGAVFEAWTELDCPLDTDKAPEAVELTGDGETSLKGQRYRLKVRTVHCQGALAVQAKAAPACRASASCAACSALCYGLRSRDGSMPRTEQLEPSS